MMYTLAAVLALLWLLGLVCHDTMGGAIHILLVAAIVLFLARRMGDRKRSHLSEQQARSRQQSRDIGAPKTWNLK